MGFERNTLDEALSPYLVKHRDNPIHWQEWSAEAVAYARAEQKLLFLSSGYSTCHWCHVMAREAFSDPAVAKYLNAHFVPIKVDRETRPDIDTHLMRICIAMTGSGGWPLNVTLTPELEPVHAMTYVPVKPAYGMPGLIEILRSVKENWKTLNMRYRAIDLSPERPKVVPNEKLADALKARYDWEHSGFGRGQKFPPHCTLIFLLYQEDEVYRKMAVQTLKAMAVSGLHDHLQGGFFRYTVDREWRIPHFEKMLYDQALHLWVYSLAHGRYPDLGFDKVAAKVCKCLEETFDIGGLYAAGLDADTDGKEGATYTWSYSELSDNLEQGEFKLLKDHYEVTKRGNFEDLIHLIKHTDAETDGIHRIEEKLLEMRKKRDQPFRDDKSITAWNALAGIGLLHAYRYLGDERYLARAEVIINRLKDEHLRDGVLRRFAIHGMTARPEFLEDHSALLLFATYMHEQTGSYEDLTLGVRDRIRHFDRDGNWLEADEEDFIRVPAGHFDHPTPSSPAMVQMGLARTEILMDLEKTVSAQYRRPYHYDFNNIVAMITGGEWRILNARPDDWTDVPVNSIALPPNREKVE